METPAIDKLLNRCNEMDITEQSNYLGDAIMPYSAKKELSALKSELAAKDALLAECASVIAPFADRYEKDFIFTVGGMATIEFGWLRNAAELAKKLEGMK